MPALRRRKTVCGVPHAAAGLRELRSGLCLHRFRRWPRGVHHHHCRRNRGRRRAEKHALIAQLTERLAAAPVALSSSAQWRTLTAPADEFRRVRFSATYEAGPDAMVYSAGSAIRDDVSGPGTWAFMPARLPT